MKELTLVIPAKNEADCLPTVLSELKNFDCKKIIVIPKNDLITQNAIKNFDCKIINYQLIPLWNIPTIWIYIKCSILGVICK